MSTSEGDSFLQRMDAVTKFVWLVAVTAILLVTSSALENLVIFAWLLFVGGVLGRLSVPRLVLRILPLTVVGLWLLVVMSVFYQGAAGPDRPPGPDGGRDALRAGALPSRFKEALRQAQKEGRKKDEAYP